MKIAIYCITKNEEKFVDRMISSVLDADEIVIVDTGSTDQTVPLIQKWCSQYPTKVKLFHCHFFPWRFDTARNFALGCVSPDIDVCVALDLDEIMTNGWYNNLKKSWKPETTRLFYTYVWDWKQDGTPNTVFFSDKIHKRTHYRWHHPVHEVLQSYLINEVITYAEDNAFAIHHHPDQTKSRGQYLKLLELSVSEDPEDDRNSFYLGREYYFHYRYNDCIKELERHRSLKKQTWHIELAASYRLSAKCYNILGDAEKAIVHAHKSIEIAPEYRESWTELANAYYSLRAWEDCFKACDGALKIQHAPKCFTADHTAFGSRIHDLMSIAAWELDKKDIAIEQIKLALQIEPDNQRFIDNLNYMSKHIDG